MIANLGLGGRQASWLGMRQHFWYDRTGDLNRSELGQNTGDDKILAIRLSSEM